MSCTNREDIKMSNDNIEYMPEKCCICAEYGYGWQHLTFCVTITGLVNLSAKNI